MASERVLIVDDEEGIRKLLGELCRREGYDVALAQDAKGAFQALEQGRVDVGIVDLHLPGTNGLEVVRRAKQLYPDCEVIILTGHGGKHSAVESLRLGAYEYLEKPLAQLELIPLTISRALARQRLGRRNKELVRELQEANRELGLRRRQQLGHIRHIGEALAGALQSFDVARVLVQAILGSIVCDGAGVLLLPRNDPEPAVAMTGAPKLLSPEANRALVATLIRRLPEGLRPDPGSVEVRALPTESTEVDDAAWGLHESGQLAVRDHLLGVVVVARHGDAAFGDEALGVFGILVSQGRIALENAHLFARMRELATRDSLTGLYNHGHFFELLEAEISRAERYGQELAVIMLDIDKEHGLKFINDTYGHQQGDAVLRDLSRLLRSSLRRADVVARYGGDEFIVLAPQTSKQEALALAHRICRRVRETAFAVSGHEEHVTVSVGVAVFHPGESETASSLVARVDRGLYLAKSREGDQVHMVANGT